MFKKGDKVAFASAPNVLIGTVMDSESTSYIQRLDGKAHCIFTKDGVSHRDARLAPWPPVVLWRETTLFFVFNPQGGGPRVPHTTHESAKAEAERLAKLQPAHKFYVLKAVDEYSATVTVNHEAL